VSTAIISQLIKLAREHSIDTIHIAMVLNLCTIDFVFVIHAYNSLIIQTTNIPVLNFKSSIYCFTVQIKCHEQLNNRQYTLVKTIVQNLLLSK